MSDSLPQHPRPDGDAAGFVESFEDLALVYDRIIGATTEVFDLEGWSFADALELPVGARILDCAVGTGLQSVGLLQRGFEVFASDVSLAMLRLFRQRARGLGFDPPCVVAGFQTLGPWSPGSFDGIVCGGNSLPLVARDEDVRRTLESILARLRPGGRLALGLRDYGASLKLGEFPTELGGVRLEVRRTDGAHVVRYRVAPTTALRSGLDVEKRYLDRPPAWFARELLRAGFEDVRIRDHTGVHDYVEGAWYIVAGVRHRAVHTE